MIGTGSTGYAVGRRYLRRLLDGALNRFLRLVRRRHLDRVEPSPVGSGAADGPHRATALAFSALGAGAFARLTYDVLTGGASHRDVRAHAFVVAHRADWLNLALVSVTWLGSSVVLVPLLLAVTAAAVRRRRLRSATYVWAAFLGAVVLHNAAKRIVVRPRPPATHLIGPASGLSYPSGHTTQAIAAWGMLAAPLLAGRSGGDRAALLAVVTAMVLLVGVSRVYLGAHWLTDVLGGYALGGAWLALLLALYRRRGSPEDRVRMPRTSTN